MIIFKEFLSDNEFDLLVKEIDNIVNDLDYNLKSIPIDKVLYRMGFPSNWENIGRLKKIH